MAVHPITGIILSRPAASFPICATPVTLINAAAISVNVCVPASTLYIVFMSIIILVCSAANARESANGNGVAPIAPAPAAYQLVSTSASFDIASILSFRTAVCAFLIAFFLPSDMYLYVSSRSSSAPLGFNSTRLSSISTSSVILLTLTTAFVSGRRLSSITLFTKSDSLLDSLFVNTPITGISASLKILSSSLSASSILSPLSLMQSHAI